MNVALSTMWWNGQALAPEVLARRTRDLGFEQVELDYRLPLEVLPALRSALQEAGLGVSSIHAPFPRPGKGDPLLQADLAAADPAARQRARALIGRTLEEAARWGAGVVVLHAGSLNELKPLEDRLKALYLAGQGGAAILRDGLRRRRARVAPALLERVRAGLADLVPRAQALGVVIGLENRASFRDIPSLGEMGALLDEFGPTLAYWHDTGHAFRLEALGFYPQTAWLERYGQRLAGLHLHDCVAIEDHLPPGQGEVPFDRLARHIPPQGRRVIEVCPHHEAEAVASGLEVLRTRGVIR